MLVWDGAWSPIEMPNAVLGKDSRVCAHDRVSAGKGAIGISARQYRRERIAQHRRECALADAYVHRHTGARTLASGSRSRDASDGEHCREGERENRKKYVA